MGTREPSTHLTASQRTVLELIAQGLTTAEIAKAIHRSVRTVESHRYQLGKKLEARNQVELILHARQRGLLPREASAGLLGASRRGDVGVTPAGHWPSAMLRLVESCFNSGLGSQGIDSAVAHLMQAFEGRAAFFAHLEPPVVHRVIVSRSLTGSLLGLEWMADEIAWHRLLPGQVATRRFEELPDELATSMAHAVGIFERCTITPVHSDERALGVLGLVHDGVLDARRMPDVVFRSIAGKVASDVAICGVQHRVQLLESVQSLVESHRRAGGFRIDVAKRRAHLSASASEMLGLAAGRREGVGIEALLARVHRADRDRVRAELESALRGLSELVLSFRLTDETLGARARVAVRARGVAGSRHQPGELSGICFIEAADSGMNPEAHFAIQMIVSRCPNPTLLLGGHGEILAASPGWREVVDGISGAFHPANYVEAARRLFEESAWSRLESVLWKSVSESADDSAVYRVLMPLAGADGHVLVEVYPIPTLSMAIVVHRAQEPEKAGSLSTREEAFPVAFGTALAWAFEKTSDMVCVCDTYGRFRRVNQAFCRVLERDESELSGMRYTELLFAEDLWRVQRLVVHLTTGVAVGPVTLRMRTPRGDAKYVEWSCAPPHPGSTLFVPIGRDVTDQVEAAMLIQDARNGLARYLTP